jgi:GTP diphosphokinase / guanosine-3',5'-bis(diphosphate) 3'-diphosphatase
MLNNLINRANRYAELKHEKQLDDSGKPYILHCIRVSVILSMVTNDEDIISAGFLHDTLEDTNTTYEDLKELFNERIANIVREVTHEGKKDDVGFYFPRLHTKEAIMVKYADRLDNLSRMDSWDLERQKHYLRKSQFWKSEPRV